MNANLKYEYSTKNFHRFGSTEQGAVPHEVYIPRANMPQPVDHIQVTTVAGTTVVAEKAKPLKAPR